MGIIFRNMNKKEKILFKSSRLMFQIKDFLTLKKKLLEKDNFSQLKHAYGAKVLKKMFNLTF